jgi:hypothetical protein
MQQFHQTSTGISSDQKRWCQETCITMCPRTIDCANQLMKKINFVNRKSVTCCAIYQSVTKGQFLDCYFQASIFSKHEKDESKYSRYYIA